MNVCAHDANIAILEVGELQDDRYVLPKIMSHRDAEISSRENDLNPQQGAFHVDVPYDGQPAAQACEGKLLWVGWFRVSGQGHSR